MKRNCLCIFLILCMLLAASMPTTGMAGNEPVFSGIGQVAAYFRECADRMEEEISFYYTSDLDSRFAESDAVLDMAYGSSMIDWRLYMDPANRKVTLKDVSYYPGYRILWARNTGSYEILTEDERAALAYAEEMVGEACLYAQSPYEVLRQLHDRLIVRVTYEVTNSKSDWVYGDTALGALLNGSADCDGYADAFRLLCGVAGFEAVIQRGLTGPSRVTDSHMWNLIRIDDLWYQVDVTWDDPDYAGHPDMCRYRYFIIGSEMMEDHFWDEELSPYPQASWNNWEWFFYTCDNSGIAYGAYYNTLKDAAKYASYMQREWGSKRIHVMVDGNYSGGAQLNEALGNAGFSGRWLTWWANMGEYTCFDILVLE